jgi:hypothetical protein
MTDDAARHALLDELAWLRDSVVWKLDGLSEYDVRRPLTPTGTNLLGLVKHLAYWEARYLGDVMGRPFPEPLPRWQDSDESEMYAAADERRDGVVGLYRRAAAHADATLRELPLDAPGHVPWWPRPDVTLAGVAVHVLVDTARHAGHADILREHLDGTTGTTAGRPTPIDEEQRTRHWAQVEAAARQAPGH